MAPQSDARKREKKNARCPLNVLRVARRRKPWLLLVGLAGLAGVVAFSVGPLSWRADRSSQGKLNPGPQAELQEQEGARPSGVLGRHRDRPAAESPEALTEPVVEPAEPAPKPPPTTSSLPEPGAVPSEPIPVPPEPSGPPSGPAAIRFELPFSAPRPESTPEEKQRALRKEQLDVAISLVERLPDRADAMCFMGLVHEEQGSTVEAVRCWEKSLKLDPNRADAYDGMGRVAWLEGKWENAATMFRRALEIDPKAPGIRFRLAEALIGSGRIGEAVPVLKEDLTVFPTASESHRLLAEAYVQLKEYSKAKQHYQAAVETRPRYTEAYYGLASACARLGQKDEAREYRKRFQELMLEDQQKTRRQWKQLSETLGGTRRSVAYTHTEAGRVCRLCGYSPEAEKLWRRAATLDPANTASRIELAALYQRTGREPEALRIYQQLVQIEPANWLNHYYAGILNARLKQYGPAEKAFRKVMQFAPRRSEGYRALAQLYLQTNRNLPEAKTLATRAVELEPIAPNYFILSGACDRNGDRPRALEAVEQAVRLQPDNPKYRGMREMLRQRQ